MGAVGMLGGKWAEAGVCVGFAAFMCLACGVYLALAWRCDDGDHGQQHEEQAPEPPLTDLSAEQPKHCTVSFVGQDDWYCPVCLALARRNWPTVAPAAVVARTCVEHRSLASVHALGYDRDRYHALLRKPELCLDGEHYRVLFGAPMRSYQRN